MAYLIGVGLALAVSLMARIVGLDRDRAFYPTVMIVIASYYGLFAVMGGSTQALGMESVAIAAFLGSLSGHCLHMASSMSFTAASSRTPACQRGDLDSA